MMCKSYYYYNLTESVKQQKLSRAKYLPSNTNTKLN